MSSIQELALIISSSTSKVNDYYTSKGLPFPSFAVDAPSSSLISPKDEEVEAARNAIIDATLKLRILMLGPRDYLQSFMHNELISMQVISRFKIASSFPVYEEASFDEIAKTTGLSEHNVRRFLRHAMTKHIFHEPRKGFVAHTAASQLLSEDEQMLDWVSASTDELWQAACQTVNAMERWPGSQEPNQTGFALANNSEKSIYEILAQYPQRAKRFGNAMTSYTQGAGYDLKLLERNYPWAALGEATIVDVGGSHGSVCIHLATVFPSLTFVVQDFPPVIEAGSSQLSSQDPSLASRITFQAHDFLTEQPVKGADVYFFRWIFHNWSDAYSVRILRNLIPALKPGARIVVHDNLLPEPGTMALWAEEGLRCMDLTMLELQNSREREMDDWKALFEMADGRFKFLGGNQPNGSRLWILEAVWEGELA
ncbi:MAG: hypothetical protein Q9187_004464 [Circinaria calcarea]